MRIAIASSGLGHVARGVETWACDTAVALAQTMNLEWEKSIEQKETKETKGRDLISAEGGEEKSSLLSLFPSVQASSIRDSVTLFCAAPLANPVSCHVVPLSCLKRGDPLAKFLTRIMPGFTWRWGLKDTYGWEQFTFWMLLWPKLRRGKFDILHVQDPMVANWCRLFRGWGLVKTKEILAHGTEESVEFLNRFDYVQHLAPWHLEQALKKIEEKKRV